MRHSKGGTHLMSQKSEIIQRQRCDKNTVIILVVEYLV